MAVLQALKTKFVSDSIFTLTSVVLTMGSALAFNILIASFYGSAGLGVFNLSYSVFAVASQCGALGMPMAVLKYCAEHAHDEEPLRQAATTGFCCALAAGIVVAGICVVARSPLAWAMHSPDLEFALLMIAPGVLLFSINKVLLNTLNAVRMMRAYSVFFSARPILILFGISITYLYEAPARALPVALSAAEAVLSIALLIFCAPKFLVVPYNISRIWFTRMVSFGIKSIPGGFFAELNTRIDILMLGLFVSDSMVGIYSFAAMLVEGLNQIPFVFRRNVDPILTQLYSHGKRDELIRMIHKGILISYPTMFALGVIAVACYPFLIRILMTDDTFMQGYLAFTILVTGCCIQGGYIPFSGILTQCGLPGVQTYVLLLACLASVIANLVFIPLFGIAGAATSTAFVYAANVYWIKLFTRKHLGLSI